MQRLSHSAKSAVSTLLQKGLSFRALHQADGAFIIPNPWDVGTARLLASLGFRALATTSAGFAFSVGRRDNSIGRERSLAHVTSIALATDLPVSADLDNGFGDSPDEVAKTITLAANSGVVGGSIEDYSKRSEQPIYEQALAVERIAAAAAAIRALRFPFMLTARAENYVYAQPDLKDTIKRLQAYQDAGADVLYAPGLTRIEDIRAVVNSVDRPVNVLMGSPGSPYTLDELARAGVKRVSVGAALARTALAAFLRGAREMREYGSFTFGNDAVNYQTLNDQFAAYD